MKRKISKFLGVGLALVLVLSFSLVTAVPAGAQVIEVWVDDNADEEWYEEGEAHFATIQDGINAVAEAGTINVAAGTYAENITIDKSLTLEGANAGIPATEVRGPESIIDAQLADFGVFIFGETTTATLDGFTVRNYEVGGILAGAFSPVEADPFEVHILNNLVEAPSSLVDAHNNNIQMGDGTIGTIIGNEVSGAHLVDPDWSGSGIIVASTNGVVISNNHAYSCDIGIAIIGYTHDGRTPSEGNIIEYNDVESCGAGIGVQRQSIGTIIRYNDVSNNDAGIESAGYPDDVPSGTEVHYNNIVGNLEYGVASIIWGEDPGVPEQVDATLNWWGSANGPTHAGNTFNVGEQGDAVSDNVLYCPWYDTDMTSTSFAPVTTDEEPAGEYSSIQSAIDSASTGDTINVAAGMYLEHIRIDKPLTLRSTDGAEQTIIDGIAFRYMVDICSSDVTFEGFTVTNPTYAGGADATGILIQSTEAMSNVHILNNIVTQVRSETGTASMFGATGINIGKGPLSDIVISGNTITNIKNPDGATVDHTCGINVWDGAENVEISNNTISDIKYNGILLEYASNVRIEGNSITGCEVGIKGVTVSGLTVNFNNFANNSSIQVFDGAGALVIEDVLANNTFDRAVVIERPAASLLHTIWSSIQDGINAADPDDTVTVAAGTYDEYVDIYKSLTLSGQPGAIIKPSTPVDAPIIGINADGVTVEGFEVDGTGLTPEVWAGIGSWSGCNDVTIRGNTIHDIANVVDSGLGIGLWRGGGNIYEDILIEGNTIYNTDRMGIYIGALSDGAWLLSDNITIRDNEVYDTMLKPNVGETFPGGCGGIAIDAAKNCTIEGNTVYDTANTMPGVFLAHGSGPGNQMLGNEVYNQAYGIAVEIDRGGGDVDFGADSPTPPEIHFNNIHDNVEYGLIVFNADGKVVDATNNWWGHASGPIHVGTNPLATGNEVSDNVDFEPWFGAGVENSKTETVTGGGTVDAITEADTEVVVTGTATVTATQYSSNPGRGFAGSTGKYIDVHIDDPAGVTEIEIKVYYTNAEIAGLVESSLILRWWDGTRWIGCSDSGVNTTDIPPYSGYIWAKIRNDTIPTLDQLSGTAFGGSGRAPIVGPAPPPVPPPGTTDVRGKVSTAGVFTRSVTAISEDGLCTLTIPEGTVGLTEELEPLTEITIVIMDEPPPPPEAAHVIGLVYDLEPDGATFEPPITLTFSYDPADIPEGVAEEDLVLAYYDEATGEWVELEGVVDTVTNTITALVAHFTAFGATFIPAPAAFSLSGLEVSPAEVEIGSPVTISAVVENTGEKEGTCEVTLKINDKVGETKEVALEPGASEEVTFTTSRDVAGSYSVDVNGLTGSFAVKAPPELPPEEAPPEEAPPEVKPISWPLVGGLIAAVVVIVGLLIFFLVRRRATT